MHTTLSRCSSSFTLLGAQTRAASHSSEEYCGNHDLKSGHTRMSADSMEIDS
jgi:hypothetical protein